MIYRRYFFTDRSVYRPGDTLRFAGVIFSKEISGSKAVAGETQNITLYGVNGKIAEHQVKSDNYGVFADYFVLPEEITGYIRIEGYNGSQSAQIAEYKKATFRISLENSPSPYFTGNPIILSGHVTGYTGEAITHATVNFRSKRHLTVSGEMRIRRLPAHRYRIPTEISYSHLFPALRQKSPRTECTKPSSR